MQSVTKKVALYYGLWVILCVTFTASGYGDSYTGHIFAIVTGLPLSIISLEIIPNGSAFATFIAGLLGWLQWCIAVEFISRWYTKKGTNGSPFT